MENAKNELYEYFLTNVIFKFRYTYKQLYTKLYEDKTGVIYPISNHREFKEDGVLFYCSLRLAFPEVNIKAKGLDAHKTKSMIKYGASLSSKKEYIFLSPRELTVEEDKMLDVTNWHNLYIEFAKRRGDIFNNFDSDFLPIIFSELQYSQACEALTIEESFMYLYSALESLCCSPAEQINDTVSKIIATNIGKNINECKQLQHFIKSNYNIRSKQIHGDFNKIINIMGNTEKKQPYDDKYTDNIYYKLKGVVAQALYFYMDNYLNKNLSPKQIYEKMWDNFYSFDVNNLQGD